MKPMAGIIASTVFVRPAHNFDSSKPQPGLCAGETAGLAIPSLVIPFEIGMTHQGLIEAMGDCCTVVQCPPKHLP